MPKHIRRSYGVMTSEVASLHATVRCLRAMERMADENAIVVNRTDYELLY